MEYCKNGLQCKYFLQSRCKFLHPNQRPTFTVPRPYIFKEPPSPVIERHWDRGSSRLKYEPPTFRRGFGRSPSVGRGRSRPFYGDSVYKDFGYSRVVQRTIYPDEPRGERFSRRDDFYSYGSRFPDEKFQRTREWVNNSRQQSTSRNVRFGRSIPRSYEQTVRSTYANGDPPMCRNGSSCKFRERGNCRYSHPIPCRNGNSCLYLKTGTCKFYHEPHILMKSKDKADFRDREKCQVLYKSIEEFTLPKSAENSLKNEKLEDNYPSLPAQESQMNTFILSRLGEIIYDPSFTKEETSPALYQDIPCIKSGENATVTDNFILERIISLPEEIKIEILRKLDLEELLSHDLDSEILRLALHLPGTGDFGSLMARELCDKDVGLIHIPEGNRLFLSNFDTCDLDSLLSDSKDEWPPGSSLPPLQVSDITPSLRPGVYKVRLLDGGVDLCLAGSPFLSSHCGPLACTHQKQGSSDTARPGSTSSSDSLGEGLCWVSSLSPRGWVVQVEQRNDLALYSWLVGSPSPHSWSLPREQGYLRAPVLVIMVRDSFWERPWSLVASRVHSKEDNRSGENRMKLHTLLDSGGGVVGYAISGSHFKGFNPLERFSPEQSFDSPSAADRSNEASFCVVRYGESDEETTGFIITGSKPTIDRNESRDR